MQGVCLKFSVKQSSVHSLDVGRLLRSTQLHSGRQAAVGAALVRSQVQHGLRSGKAQGGRRARLPELAQALLQPAICLSQHPVTAQLLSVCTPWHTALGPSSASASCMPTADMHAARPAAHQKQGSCLGRTS